MCARAFALILHVRATHATLLPYWDHFSREFISQSLSTAAWQRLYPQNTVFPSMSGVILVSCSCTHMHVCLLADLDRFAVDSAAARLQEQLVSSLEATGDAQLDLYPWHAAPRAPVAKKTVHRRLKLRRIQFPQAPRSTRKDSADASDPCAIHDEDVDDVDDEEDEDNGILGDDGDDQWPLSAPRALFPGEDAALNSASPASFAARVIHCSAVVAQSTLARVAIVATFGGFCFNLVFFLDN